MLGENSQIVKERPIWLQGTVVGLILLFFFLIGAFSIREKSKTSDENAHYLYGRNIVLKGDATRFDDSKMPITALNALPRKWGRALPSGAFRSFIQEFWAARMVTLLFSALVALIVFIWSRSLYGFIPALFSLVLYILDPNILAHSRLVTTDIYAAGTTIFLFFFLWRFAHRRNLFNGLLCALALGLSLIAKYSAIVLIPLAFVTLLIFDTAAFLESYDKQRTQAVVAYLRRYIVYLIVAFVVVGFVVNISFLSTRTFAQLEDYQFQSDFFRSIQQIPAIKKISVPLPYPYLEGLDLVLNNERTGVSYGNIYLLGQIRHGNDGFTGYYFIASLLKVPIASQVIYLLAFYVYLRDPNRRSRFFADDIFLLVPVLFFTIYYNFFFNAQIGIRYYLVVFPFLYVFSGQLFSDFTRFSNITKRLALGSVAYLLFSVLSYYPNFLPYFNEFVWNRSHAYRYLADSNVDWGQNSDKLGEYLSAHPGAIFAPEEVQSGHIVLSVNDLTGVSGGPEKYEWLRESFKPVNTISYSYLVYEISEDELVGLCVATDYCK
ncbi:MAG: glycosyltransferase family 39 protein [Anaerolineales bacterium]